MAITAPMPMTMPKLVSAERPLFTSRAAKATRMAERRLIEFSGLRQSQIGNLKLEISGPARRHPLQHAAVLARDAFEEVAVEHVALDKAVADGHAPARVLGDCRVVRDQDNGLSALAVEALELGENLGAGLG